MPDSNPAKVLCIGLGGLGVIAAWTLQRNGSDVTAIIRSDYERVKTLGYTIHSLDEGQTVNYVPTRFYNSIEQVKGPFDYIVVTTKVIPKNDGSDVWDLIGNSTELLKEDKTTGIVLIENGIGIESYWNNVRSKAVLLLGTSYISSTNTKAEVKQYGTDNIKFGLFQGENKPHSLEVLDRFIDMYKTKSNKVVKDENVQHSRWKKLLYNAVYNTICCLVDLDVGRLYELKDSLDIVNNLILPLMKEVQFVANQDLRFHESNDLVTDEDVKQMEMLTAKFDAPNFYAPSMLMDLRNSRAIELEIILGNILKIYDQTGGKNRYAEVPYLNLLYIQLALVQYRISLTK